MSQKQSIICSHCGESHPKGVVFCPNTGKPVKKTIGKKTAMVFILTVALILTASFAYKYIFIPGQPPSPPPVEPVELIKPVEPIEPARDYIISSTEGYDFIICDFDSATQKNRLYLINSSGKKYLLLRNFEDHQRNPSISRNRNWFVFQKGYGEEAKVHVLNLKEKKEIHKDGFEGKMPSISPDGKKIVYLPLRFVGEERYLNIMNLEHQKITRGRTIDLPSAFKTVQYPVFLKDSKILAFIGSIGTKRKNIFVYDPDDLFSYKPVDSNNRKFKYLTDSSDTHFSLTASLNKYFLFYSIKKNIYLMILDDRHEDPLGKELGITAKFPAFSLNDDKIFSISDNQIISVELIYRNGRFERVSTEIKKVDESNLNQPQKIISIN